ncbi:hypothetical protein COW94_03570 [Candidatus Peregrinibacteria bacterium CG22_combo_CG10-13_8_21_14_all_44_10]|nr:MAG: hypothetical protein AUK45_04580 [Candidatus Peregrinibacteria bacterium CG2_30_44_17]PIP66095.1 MAG: hypothetical protein COW94_03570 [Candidatus Peregrinibacteria bacterium CG22_combo_CG10-13_8_21_14_all_44_10]PIX78926.1 MAG: hypothetical protein COZ35_04400 [Candidatus Peregrinibacteria bacterium CG_4_10_14_3_um_filter_44_21]PJB89416.1 MAG: hypothetical protein CO082_01025 [Candidatus Peregrinibacteria bacterium CG_4_9_14_0_8_um_filter_44_15]
MSKRFAIALLLVFIVIFVAILSMTRLDDQGIFSAPTTFEFVTLTIGEAQGDPVEGSIFMPEIVPLDDGSYRMFFAESDGKSSAIKYADSSDGISWEVKGVALEGEDDLKSPLHLIGGPSIVRLENGDFRMYYRATTDHAGDPRPLYQNFSAVSHDGMTFTPESGTRIPIQNYDQESPFVLAGHGRYFEAEDGTLAAIVSLNTLDDQNGPSDLALMTSEDGLTWENYEILYEDWHDPTVVQIDGYYLMYATYLTETQGVAVSTDGLNWPDEMLDVDFVDADGNVLTEADGGVGDIAAAVISDGEIWIYTNYGRPGRDIALFKQQ